ncbi:MAG: oligosaccharide flippase family protein [archaeon]
MIKKIYNYFMKESLYRNSIYLILSSFVMGALGFFFWMINSRLFTAHQIGLGTTLISVISLITTFSLLGLNTGIIRFLPTAENKNDKINTVITISVLTSVIVSTIFLLGLKFFSPDLLFIKRNLYYSIFFIGSMIIMTLFSLIDSVFIAYRNTKFVLVKNTIFSFLKLFFPFLLVSFGALGIFGSFTLSALFGFLTVLIILIFKFKYKFKFLFYDNILKKIFPFSFGNYIAGFFGSLPVLLLPLLITRLINPETTAYYYMAMMIAGLLFVIPNSISSSLFAEGSYKESNLKEQIKKSAKFISLIMIPAIILIFFLGQYILLLFGENYSAEGFRLLQILALSGIFIAVNSVFASILRVRHKIKALIIVNAIGALVLLALSYLLISQGLTGIGIAWIIGQFIVTLLYAGFVLI